MSSSARTVRALDRAEHRAHVRSHAARRRRGDRLVEQRQAIAQRAIGRAREHVDAFVVERDASRRRGSCRIWPTICSGGSRFRLNLQAARQHGHRQLLRIGRREQELHVRRRLFERLQQRVERALRQHVHFVDQVDLEAAARRRVLRVVDQLAHVVDAGVAGGVDLEQIDEAARVDLAARTALAARVRA